MVLDFGSKLCTWLYETFGIEILKYETLKTPILISKSSSGDKINCLFVSELS